MALPTTMHGVQISQVGGVEVLDYKTELPVPELQEGQVLVRNEYAGVNYIDTYFRTGLYKASLPLLLGREAAGSIVAVHESVTSLKVGDAVVYMADDGCYATYKNVPASRAIRLPEHFSTSTAAAALLQGLTAWTFIQETGRVQSGQWTLVHAAAGGVGGLLVQMLKSIGAKVIGTASTPEKCELARSYGAQWIVNSKEDDMVSRVNEITDGHGVDVIFDGVGKATFDGDFEMVAKRGKIICFGNASGAVPPFDILRLGSKNVKLARPLVTHYVDTSERLEKYSEELFGLISEGKVAIQVHETYPLRDVARAHTDLESRKTIGKLLLKIE